jgi:hypothetical protein
MSSPFTGTSRFLETVDETIQHTPTYPKQSLELDPELKRGMTEQSMEFSEQTALLREIRNHIASQSTPRQFAWNVVLQIVCVTIAFMFGVYSISDHNNSTIAVNLAFQQNQLAILSLCTSSNSVRIILLNNYTLLILPDYYR